jgi:hypothetical protein
VEDGEILLGKSSLCLPREGELGEGMVDLLITILELDGFLLLANYTPKPGSNVLI